jgi:hypothetical protein
MFDQMTLWDTPSATSSPAWADGPLQPALPAGQTIAPCGPRPAPVSRSRSPAKAQELLMRGTFGPTFSDSCVPAGPLSSWESRLRQRLGRIGSSECDLTWKASAMSDGVLLSRLVPSTPRTVEIDCGLLLEAATWITPTTRDHKDTPGMSLERSDGRSRVDQLPRQVAATMAAHWSTPRASDGEKGGPNQSFGAGGQPLPAQAFHAAMWPTPMAGTPAQNGNSAAGNNDSSRKTVEIARGIPSAMWPTATAVDGQRGLTTRPQDTGIPLPQRVGQVLGIPPAGSSATTAKRGVLNPLFVSWLMGFPMSWVMCFPSKTERSKK